MAETDLYPSLTLLGSIGWSASSVDGSSRNLDMGAGPSLSWNIFDQGRLTNNVRVQDARLQQLLETYRDAVTPSGTRGRRRRQRPERSPATRANPARV